MRLFTKERSWANFWVIVVVGVVLIGATAVMRPDRVWLVAGFNVIVWVLLLLDSYIAGNRERQP